MRLLMTTDTVGGVWTYSGDLARGMLERGDELLLLSVGRGPDAQQKAWLAQTSRDWPETFRSRHVNVPLEWMEDGAEAYARSEAEIVAICSDFRPDLLHCNQFCYGALPLVKNGRAVPRIVVAHSDVLSWWRARYGEPMPESPWRTAYVEQVVEGLAGADVVIAPTGASLRELRESFCFATETRVIPNGRTTTFAALTDADLLAGKRMQALTCGRMWDEGKNLGVLEKMRSFPLPLLLAGQRSLGADGDGSETPDSVPHAKRVSPDGETASGQLQLVGALSPDALATLMRECAIYVVTSRYEPFGLAAVEAALAGCAIVASDIASQREVWGDAAVFFRNNDPEALEAVLASLATNSGTLGGVAMRCRQRALTLFKADRMVADYAALYDELTGARGMVVQGEARRGVCAA